MELILEVGLEHQEIPVRLLVEALRPSVHISAPSEATANPELNIAPSALEQAVRTIQDAQGIPPCMRPQLPSPGFPVLDIKMETGTGKTYVYTHALYALHRAYGLNKFILLVPSLAIKAGAQQFMADSYTLHHFADTLGYHAQLKLGALSPQPTKKGKHFFPSVVREFVAGTHHDTSRIYLLLINQGMLTTGKMLSRDDYDYAPGGFLRPFDALRATRPVVIIDEPHRFAENQRAWQIIHSELQPQLLLRFGATFPQIASGWGKQQKLLTDYRHLLYDLNACKAFNGGLIKGVAKEHFELPGAQKAQKVKVERVDANRVTFACISSRTRSTRTLQPGDTLGVLSEALAGLRIEACRKGLVLFSNGLQRMVGQEFAPAAYSSSYQEQMLALALKRHFEVERTLFCRQPKIKALALFFIDSIESFRGNDQGHGAWLREAFDRLLRQRLRLELENPDTTPEYAAYLEASLHDLAACRAGYFARDNSDSDLAVGLEVEEILHNKKLLLAFSLPDGRPNLRRFLFSKWTLKEGWDNPNVFTIAKLRSSGSEISKLQEVGRGLRLPVDELGHRQRGQEFMLNYIVDFTEADFAARLVAQINGQTPEAVGDRIPTELLYELAKKYHKAPAVLKGELMVQGLLDEDAAIVPARREELMARYPELAQEGVAAGRVNDRNAGQSGRISIRAAQFEKLRLLWARINRKYILLLHPSLDALLPNALAQVLEESMQREEAMQSQRETLQLDDHGMATTQRIAGESVAASMANGHMPYGFFLRAFQQRTLVPPQQLHAALRAWSARHPLLPVDECLSENTLARMVERFRTWEIEALQGRFCYQQADYSHDTGLTDAQGKLHRDVVQGLLGARLKPGKPVDNYLYDAWAYDSQLELHNLLDNVDHVTVYGKIPRNSIAIPTIDGGTYSPDFIYVVQRPDGMQELNIVLEVKGVERENALRGEEVRSIASAKAFFLQLQAEGVPVKYALQLNTQGIYAIVQGLLLD